MIALFGWGIDLAILCIVFGFLLIKTENKISVGKILFIFGLILLAICGISFGVMNGIRDHHQVFLDAPKFHEGLRQCQA